MAELAERTIKRISAMKEIIKRTVRQSGFEDTIRALRFDFARMLARSRSRKMLRRRLKSGPLPTCLHFGCGGKLLKGWVNCDLRGTDVDIDLGSGKLPFESHYFDVALSQHVIEHLWIHRELKPFLGELMRVLKSGGEIWLACPDIEKICDGYAQNKCADLVAATQGRFPGFSLLGLPSSQFMNDIFHKDGAHKNLFDFDLLEAVLVSEGFSDIEEVDEKAMLDRFDTVPARDDSEQTLYVRAFKP